MTRRHTAVLSTPSAFGRSWTDLLAFEEIWAAAGTPDVVFRTTPDELRRTSQAEVADLKETPAGG